MKLLPRFINLKHVAMLHDTIMALASVIVAFYLRLGGSLFDAAFLDMWFGTTVFTLIAVSVFSALRLYRGLWRFASVQDLIALTRAVTIAIGIFYVSMFLYIRLEGIPRSVPMIHWMVLLVMLGAPRFIYRVAKDYMVGKGPRKVQRIPVLLVGANENTEHFLRDTARSRTALYRVVGIIVNDAGLHEREMHGVPIYNALHDIPFILQKLARRGEKPQRIIVADDNMDGATLRALVETANLQGLTLARLPRLTEFKSGMTDGQDIRPIAVEDLLGRAQNAHEKTDMRTLIAGKRVMVTGAGGTIGSELVRQIATFEPAAIFLLEQSEFNLYQIDQELGERFPDISRLPLLADVRDTTCIDHIFTTVKPEVVFHSAAIKHVPMAEYNPEEAMLTNVIGTRHVADACVKHKALAMVLISTDKAVNPANVMGATKRLAECYCQALGSDADARGETRFITVRFGNVLGSTGSVVPLFQKQLKRGGPITVTHPDMVRYFMTVREAVELVLQAAAMGVRREETRHGLIFVVDMGEPVRIKELAEQMIRLAGLKPNEDIKIVYTGLRPGEKLYEELFHYSETSLETDHKGILLASSRKVELTTLLESLDVLRQACLARQRRIAYQTLQTLVPEFCGSADNVQAAQAAAGKTEKKSAISKQATFEKGITPAEPLTDNA